MHLHLPVSGILSTMLCTARRVMCLYYTSYVIQKSRRPWSPIRAPNSQSFESFDIYVYSTVTTTYGRSANSKLALCTHALKSCSWRTGCLCASLLPRAFEQRGAFLSPLVERCNACPNSCSKACQQQDKEASLDKRHDQQKCWEKQS